jgi:GT2 family glycosyltransferase
MNANSTPLVSVIVLNYNSQKYVSECLSSLLDTDYSNFEIIFVDNASTDDSVRIAKTFDHIEIVRTSENCGTLARNIVSSVAKGEYVAFLDSDTCVHRDWLKEALKTMETAPNAGAVQALMFYMDNDDVWCDAGFIDCFGRTFTRCAKAVHDEAYEILYATSAAVVMKKKAFDLAGGFDSDFFVYYEDTDLGWRLRKCGFTTLVAPTSVVRHAVHGSTKQMPSSIIVFHGEKNRVMMLLKNFDGPYLLKYALPYVTLLSLFAVYYMLRGREKGKIIIKGLLWNLINLPKTMAKRSRLHLIQKCSDKELMQSELLLPPLAFLRPLSRRGAMTVIPNK